MTTKIFLLTLTIGAAGAAAEMYTDQPLAVVAQIIAAGQSVEHVTIKTA